MEIVNNWEYAGIIARFMRVEISENFTLVDFCNQVNPFFLSITNLPRYIYSIKKYDIKDDDIYYMFRGYKRLLLCLHKLMIRYGVKGCFESMFYTFQVCYTGPGSCPDLGDYSRDYIQNLINCFFKDLTKNGCTQFINYFSKSFLDIVNGLSCCSDGDLSNTIKKVFSEHSIVENFIDDLMNNYDDTEDIGSKSRAISLLIYYINNVSNIDNEELAKSIYEFLLKILKKDFENFYTFENSCAFDVYNLKSIAGAFLKVLGFFDEKCIDETIRTFIALNGRYYFLNFDLQPIINNIKWNVFDYIESSMIRIAMGDKCFCQ